MPGSIFEVALEHVLRSEGGYSNHAEDPGGKTQKGITQATFDSWRKEMGRATEDVRSISDAEVHQIYETKYWRTIRGDELPRSIAVVMFDAAVNSGPGNAVKALQKALRALSKPVKVDGLIGPSTLRAANAAPEEALLDEFIVQRGRFYGLIETFRTFGLGWARRLVAGARLAHKVLDESRSVPEDVPPESEGEAEAGTGAPVRRAGTRRIMPPTELRRYFYEGQSQQTYGSFFRLWGGWATAGHVVSAMQHRPPPFAKGGVVLGGDALDVALIGCTLPDRAPALPYEGQELVAMGFPAGAHLPAIRRCKVYQRRPGSQVWISQISAPGEPVVVGMSGGVVFDERTQTLVGVIVHRNSPADLDGDGQLDQSLDFVALADAYQQLASSSHSVMVA